MPKDLTWVCAQCGAKENTGCIHAKDPTYSLITWHNYRQVRKMIEKQLSLPSILRV
jgi:hypothetical protein